MGLVLPVFSSCCCCCAGAPRGAPAEPAPLRVLPSPPVFNPSDPVEVILHPINLITTGGAYVAPSYGQALTDVQNYQVAFSAQGVGPEFHYTIRTYPGAVVLVQN